MHLAECSTCDIEIECREDEYGDHICLACGEEWGPLFPRRSRHDNHPVEDMPPAVATTEW